MRALAGCRRHDDHSIAHVVLRGARVEHRARGVDISAAEDNGFGIQPECMLIWLRAEEISDAVAAENGYIDIGERVVEFSCSDIAWLAPKECGQEAGMNRRFGGGEQDIADSRNAICVLLQCSAINRRRVDDLTGEEEGQHRRSVGGESQPERSLVGATVRIDELAREIERRSGRNSGQAKRFVVCRRVIGGQRNRGKPLGPSQATEGAVADDELIVNCDGRVNCDLVCDRQRFKKCPIGKIDAAIGSPEWVFAIGRDGETEISQPPARTSQFGDGKNQMVKRARTIAWHGVHLKQKRARFKLERWTRRSLDQSTFDHCRLNEACEKRVRFKRAAFQLGMILNANKPGVVRIFDRFGQHAVRRHA